MIDRQIAINYLEFSVADIGRAKRFYGDVFGWTFIDYGSDYCEFTDGQMTGGFTTQSEVTIGGPLVVFYSDMLERLINNITEAGGHISKPIFQFPGGERFEFTDPDGYTLAVWRKT